MLKKIVLFILTISIIIYSYNFYIERQKQKEIVQQFMDTVSEVFVPFLENTTFSIDNDIYYLVVEGMNYTGDYSSTGLSVGIDYEIYKNEIQEDHLLTNEYRGMPSFVIDAYRYDTDSEYELRDPNTRSYLSHLFDSFTSFFYDYHFDLHNVEPWTQRSGSGTWDDDDAEYD